MLSVKPWRSDAVVLFILAQAFSVLLGSMVIVLLQKIGINGFKGLDDFGCTLLGIISFQGTTWVLIPFFLRFHDVSLGEGFGFRRKNIVSSLLLALGVGVAVLFVAYKLQDGSVMLMQKIGWKVQEEEAVSLVKNASSLPQQIFLGFYAVVLAPVAEEFIFRGMLFPYIKQHGFPKTAWIGVSLFFALIHADAAIFISLFVLALALTWLYEYTNNLLAPIFVHALFNSAGFVVLTLQNHFPQFFHHWPFSQT
jgi:membrane protease YdiL (CAAX protease family)